MFISMSDYKMIYKNVIYNILGINPYFNWNTDKQQNEMESIEVMYLDEDNRIAIIKDKPKEFQFIKR